MTILYRASLKTPILTFWSYLPYPPLLEGGQLGINPLLLVVIYAHDCKCILHYNTMILILISVSASGLLIMLSFVPAALIAICVSLIVYKHSKRRSSQRHVKRRYRPRPNESQLWSQQINNVCWCKLYSGVETQHNRAWVLSRTDRILKVNCNGICRSVGLIYWCIIWKLSAGLRELTYDTSN